MTKVLLFKINDKVFEMMETNAKRLKMSKNAYINEALDFYNAFSRRKILGKKILKESLLVRESATKRNKRIQNSLRGIVLVEKDIVNAMERKHRQSYISHPYPKKEVNFWEKEQAWGDE